MLIFGDSQKSFSGQNFRFKTYEAGQKAVLAASDHDYVRREKINVGMIPLLPSSHNIRCPPSPTISTYTMINAGTPREDTFYYKLFQDIIADILQDPLLKGHIDWEPKPLFDKEGNRIFGPFSSGMFWEEKHIQYKGKTVIVFIVYSDATDFYAGVSAHPVFSKLSAMLCIYYYYIVYINHVSLFWQLLLGTSTN